MVDRATATVRSMNPVTGLSLGRIAVGVAAVANPHLAAKSLQLDPVGNPQVPYVTRLFGIREIAIGLLTLTASGKAQRGVIGVGVLVDAGDAATAYLAMQDGTVSRKTALTLLGPAVGATASGVIGMLKRR